MDKTSGEYNYDSSDNELRGRQFGGGAGRPKKDAPSALPATPARPQRTIKSTPKALAMREAVSDDEDDPSPTRSLNPDKKKGPSTSGKASEAKAQKEKKPRFIVNCSLPSQISHFIRAPAKKAGKTTKAKEKGDEEESSIPGPASEKKAIEPAKKSEVVPKTKVAKKPAATEAKLEKSAESKAKNKVEAPPAKAPLVNKLVAPAKQPGSKAQSKTKKAVSPWPSEEETTSGDSSDSSSSGGEKSSDGEGSSSQDESDSSPSDEEDSGDEEDEEDTKAEKDDCNKKSDAGRKNKDEKVKALAAAEEVPVGAKGGRPSNQTKEAIEAGLSEIAGVVAKISQKVGLSSEQLLDAYLEHSGRGANVWNIYQKYVLAEFDTEILGLPERERVDVQSLTMDLVGRLYMLFKEKYKTLEGGHERYLRLWKRQQDVTESNTSFRMREEHFKTWYGRVQRIMKEGAEHWGFDSMFLACGRVVNQDQSLCQLSYAGMAENFLSEYFEISEALMQGHFRTHIFNVTNRSSAENIMKKILETPIIPSEQNGQSVEPAEEVQDDEESSLARKQQDHDLRQSLDALLASAKLSLRPGQKWKGLPKALAGKGYTILNWPQDVPLPFETAKKKGIPGTTRNTPVIQLVPKNPTAAPICIFGNSTAQLNGVEVVRNADNKWIPKGSVKAPKDSVDASPLNKDKKCASDEDSDNEKDSNPLEVSHKPPKKKAKMSDNLANNDQLAGIPGVPSTPTVIPPSSTPAQQSIEHPQKKKHRKEKKLDGKHKSKERKSKSQKGKSDRKSEYAKTSEVSEEEDNDRDHREKSLGLNMAPDQGLNPHILQDGNAFNQDGQRHIGSNNLFPMVPGFPESRSRSSTVVSESGYSAVSDGTVPHHRQSSLAPSEMLYATCHHPDALIGVRQSSSNLQNLDRHSSRHLSPGLQADQRGRHPSPGLQYGFNNMNLRADNGSLMVPNMYDNWLPPQQMSNSTVDARSPRWSNQQGLLGPGSASGSYDSHSNHHLQVGLGHQQQVSRQHQYARQDQAMFARHDQTVYAPSNNVPDLREQQLRLANHSDQSRNSANNGNFARAGGIGHGTHGENQPRAELNTFNDMPQAIGMADRLVQQTFGREQSGQSLPYKVQDDVFS